MLGWESNAAERASRRNRSMNPGSPARFRCRTLMATSRASSVSRARYTSPIPPEATREITWYLARTVVWLILLGGRPGEPIVGAGMSGMTEPGDGSADPGEELSRIEAAVRGGAADLSSL